MSCCSLFWLEPGEPTRQYYYYAYHGGDMDIRHSPDFRRLRRDESQRQAEGTLFATCENLLLAPLYYRMMLRQDPILAQSMKGIAHIMALSLTKKNPKGGKK